MENQRSSICNHPRKSSTLPTWRRLFSCCTLITIISSQCISEITARSIFSARASASCSPWLQSRRVSFKPPNRNQSGLFLKLSLHSGFSTPANLFTSDRQPKRVSFSPHLLKAIRGGSTENKDDEGIDELEDTDYELNDSDYESEGEISSEYDEEDFEANKSESQEEFTVLQKRQDASDDQYDESEEEDESDDDIISLTDESCAKDKNEEKEYELPMTPPAMQQFFVSIGVVILSNRINILDNRAVRIARFAFLSYIVSVQLFLIYVRIRAKQINDRTPITINNPLSSLVQGGAISGGNSLVKSIADQVLSTQTTVMEYDLKEAKKMNGSLLFPMIFLYFLHFRMKQVQPLLMQTATGFLNLVYSPLFQVYILGRNLERPFRSPNPLGDQSKSMHTSDETEEATDDADVQEHQSDDVDEDSEDSEYGSDED